MSHTFYGDPHKNDEHGKPFFYLGTGLSYPQRQTRLDLFEYGHHPSHGSWQADHIKEQQVFFSAGSWLTGPQSPASLDASSKAFFTLSGSVIELQKGESGDRLFCQVSDEIAKQNISICALGFWQYLYLNVLRECCLNIRKICLTLLP